MYKGTRLNSPHWTISMAAVTINRASSATLALQSLTMCSSYPLRLG